MGKALFTRYIIVSGGLQDSNYYFVSTDRIGAMISSIFLRSVVSAVSNDAANFEYINFFTPAYKLRYYAPNGTFIEMQTTTEMSQELNPGDEGDEDDDPDYSPDEEMSFGKMKLSIRKIDKMIKIIKLLQK